METTMNDQSGTAVRCFRKLARLIIMDNLQPGDRLPSQEDLRIRFAAGNKTLDAAMGLLVGMGVVSRRTRVGTVIEDRAPLLGLRWNVGLLTFDASLRNAGSFYAELHHMLAARLSGSGWSSATYFRSATPHWPFHRLPDFACLTQDLKADRLDGLLLLTRLHPEDWRDLDRQGVIVCHAGPWEPAQCGVVLDIARFEQDAVEYLRGAGCRRIALPDMTQPADKREFPASSAAQSAADIRSSGAVVFPYEPGAAGGKHIARRLLDMPGSERPDGIVMTDDRAAAELTGILAEGGNYRPSIAVLTNRQTRVTFPVPVTKFELDIENLAAAALNIYRNRILGIAGSSHTEAIAPKRIAAT